MPRKLTLKEVIEKFKIVHGDTYDYSSIKEYKNNRTPLPIICRNHGLFYQNADKHFHGQGCPKCAKNYRMNTESFKEKAYIVHGDDYIYDEVEYKSTDTKIKIICKKCGKEFWQTPHCHLSGQGCPFCNGNELKTNEQYIKECRRIHGDKYIYNKTFYNGAFSYVTITCPIHGDFIQLAKIHLAGHGCPECAGKRKYDKEYLINQAIATHGDKYDYSLIDKIKNNRQKVPIICPIHGTFYQTIDNHINQGQGCPKCKRSLLEEEIRKFLIENNYKFEEQKRFTWLGSQSLDFYIPRYKVAIECQGIQHFKPTNFGGKHNNIDEAFKKTCSLDDNKNKLCQNNNIRLIYFAETELDYRYPICRTKEELLNEIKKNSI